MAPWVWSTLPLLLLGSTPAGAEPRPWLERFNVVSDCPDRSAFEQAVERRVTRPLDVAFGELRLGVAIESAAAPGSPRLIGRLDITDAAGFTSTRELRANSCPQLIEALSLLAAVSADAARTLHDAPLSSPATNGTGVDHDATALPAAERAHDVGTAPPAAPEAIRLGPSFYVLLQDAATPKPELGLGLALSVAWPSQGYWAPWLQVGGYRVRSGELSVGAAGIRARFDLIAAHAVACPVRLPARGMASLRPCVELEVGQLGGEGNGAAVLRNTDRDGLWLSSALSLRGEISPWAPLSLSASLGAVLPWTRHEFFFAPDTVAFRVPPLGFRGTLAGALTF